MIIPGSDNALLLNPVNTQYRVERSLRFNSSDSAYLSRTPSSAGNRKTWTWSGWVKRAKLTGAEQLIFSYTLASPNNQSYIRFDSATEKLRIAQISSGSAAWNIEPAASFRDTSAWYHLVVSVDTTQATASNRVRVYVNGIEQTVFTTASYPSLNADTDINNTVEHRFSAATAFSSLGFDGYLAECYLIDGQQLTPASFGETNSVTGQWVPKAYTGTYGTNGFKLTFSDNSNNTATTLGKDTSGNGNNWTPTNLSVTAGAGNDSLVDTPTSYGTDTSVGGEVRGNYATLNPLDNGGQTLSNGNLESTWGSASWRASRGTIGVSSGKWYWEGTFTQGSTAGATQIGIAGRISSLTNYVGSGSDGYSYADNANRYNNGTPVSYGASYTTNDVIGVALDLDAGTLVFYKNGVSQGTAYSSLSGTFFPAVDNYNNSKWTLNFGQRPFAFPVSGFKALCDTNLPAPVVAKPNTVMDVALYTGTGSALTATSALGFSPDFVWIKGRSGATDHALYDAVRGATLDLVSNSTAAETTQTQGLTAFNSNGFSVGTLAKVNTSSATYAAWCWDAGTTTSSNVAGSITSSVRANTSAGFSVVTWTGQTAAGSIGHGLGAAPSLIICKARSNVQSWGVYHKDVGINNYLLLDTTGASTAYTGIWGSTAPTSTVFSVPGNVGLNNANTWTYVAYCFAPVAGYSSFGSYTGNGSTDGPFVYTGFRPRWLLIKQTNSANPWVLFDSARGTYNLNTPHLLPNSSGAETNTSAYGLDFLSNGFKARVVDTSMNASGSTYIYAAFAENPFQYARAR